MSCCGQKRAQWSATARSYARAPEPPPPPRQQPETEAEGMLRYLGAQPLLLRGPRSGRIYSVEAGVTVAVDGADAEALLSTQLFEVSG